MALSSGQSQSAYPTAEAVMNRARAYVNDGYRNGKGRVLTDQASFTVEFLNGALEELQDRMRSNDVITIIQDNIILGPIPALPAPDATAQISIGYNGLTVTGQTTPNVVFFQPQLPQNVVAVERLWEMEVGSGLPFKEMDEAMEGLPSILQGPWLNMWEFRTDQIVLTGSLQIEQLRMRCQIQFATIPNQGANNNLSSVQIQVLASVEAMALLVAYKFARARGAAAALEMKADAEAAVKAIIRRYTRRAQGVPYQRRAYGEAGDRRGVRLPF